MRMMEDMHVVENRGSGIRAMLQAMLDANLEPPRFADRRSSFLVAFRNHTMMNPEAIAWLNQFAHVSLNDRQRLALVYLRQHDQITNSDYQRLNRVNAIISGQDLRGLVQAELVAQHGASRWTSYTLGIPRERPELKALPTDEEKILAFVWERGSITNIECRTLLAVNEARAYYLLKTLSSSGQLKSEGTGRWRRYVLP
jgi:ATP-dependent DNA helicase RecG